MKPKFSTARLPFPNGRETGACEWSLDQYLRNLVGVDQRDWADYVDSMKFRYNVAMYLATKGSFFAVACGVRSNLLT
jgi:hypothetical protein